MKKIFDSWDSDYKSVFGALKVGKPCAFSIRIPHEMKLDMTPVMIVFRTGFKERFLSMTQIKNEEDCTVYTTSFVPKHTGIHYYYFAITEGGTRKFIKRADSNNADYNVGNLYQLTVYARDFKTPDFLKGGVMYQIFPDRFYRSGKEHKNVPEDRILRDDWGGTPGYKSDPVTGAWNNDYFCGDLEGIRQKLPYLEELGITCIYLNPVFEAHENHRYNTANYLRIDPLLGTNDDFKKLCADARRCDIEIILDGVFSHTGADSIYFNKYNRYDSLGAYNSPESPYYNWYTFYEYPDNYESWWGIPSLPNVKEDTEEYTDFICGEDGVLEYWMKLGAAGFRLDVVDELPDKFLDALNRCVKKYSAQRIILGEVWEDASNKESYGVKRRYLLGAQLDSVMNYPFRNSILKYVKGGNPFDFRCEIMTILENYPKPSIDTLMNFISTHDTERAISNLAGDPSFESRSKDWMSVNKLSAEQYEKGKNLLKCAMVLQFFMPGVPCVYYGDEAGMQGFKDPFNRGCFPWGYEDGELLSFTKELISIRKSSKVFIDGSLIFLHMDQDLLVFARARVDRKKAVVVILNRSDRKQAITPESVLVEQYKKFYYFRGYNDNGEGEIIIPPYDYAAIKVEL